MLTGDLVPTSCSTCAALSTIVAGWAVCFLWRWGCYLHVIWALSFPDIVTLLLGHHDKNPGLTCRIRKPLFEDGASRCRPATFHYPINICLTSINSGLLELCLNSIGLVGCLHLRFWSGWVGGFLIDLHHHGTSDPSICQSLLVPVIGDGWLIIPLTCLEWPAIADRTIWIFFSIIPTCAMWSGFHMLLWWKKYRILSC